MGDGFVDVRCCGDIIGHVNARLFTPEASERFAAIQQQIGNTWTKDAEANALIADPASYTAPADGTPILFACGVCGAKFAWAGGRPVQITSS